MSITQLFVRMKNSNGSPVWRNVAPQTKSDKLSLKTPLQSTSRREILSAFVPIQTEDLYINSYGGIECKIVTEEVQYVDLSPTFINSYGTVPGADSWTDTSNEKYIVNFTDGNEDYQVKLSNAATGSGDTSTTIADAVTRYCGAIQSHYQNYKEEQVPWTQVHLTGTKDSLVAQND